MHPPYALSVYVNGSLSMSKMVHVRYDTLTRNTKTGLMSASPRAVVLHPRACVSLVPSHVPFRKSATTAKNSAGCSMNAKWLLRSKTAHSPFGILDAIRLAEAGSSMS